MWWAKRRIHVSWLIAIIFFGVVVGVSLAPMVPRGLFGNFGWLILSAMLGVWVIKSRRLYLIAIALIAGVLIGLWRSDGLLNNLTVYENLVDHTVVLRGKILEDADVDSSGQTMLRVGDISVNDEPLQGKVWVSVSETELKRSDYIEVQGELGKGFGTFSAAMYRAQVISYQPVEGGDVARDVRDKFSIQVQKHIDEPAVSLGLGYLTGQRRGLPPELLEVLRVAGLTHVIVASGYNLTILIRLTRRLFDKHSKYLATAVPAGLVISFIAITGMSPSMSRAGLVTGLSLAAWYYGRRFHPLVLLSIVAGITVLIEPSYAWGDIGWLLSFSAFTGVMIFAPLLQAYFFGDKPPGNLRQILGETMSAYLFTLPIIAISFGEFSNVALMANLMILPLIPIAMIGVFLTGVASLVLDPLGAVFAWPTSIVLDYMIRAAEFWSSQSWATTQISLSWWWAGAACAVLLVICIYLRLKTNLSLRASSIVD